MTAQGTATGVALFLGFFAQYALYLYARIKKQENIDTFLQKTQKFYLFGGVGLLTIHFNGTWSAIFSWFAMLGYIFYLSTGLKDDNRKMTNLSGTIFTGFLAIWFVVTTGLVFDRVNPGE
mmetsp:Transcript_1694/g.1538  ORF Transcript_1694/g.1538 Transcript_1694/m.1538 type:complete len:120 (-) Transcript_1694:424-783(-)